MASRTTTKKRPKKKKKATPRKGPGARLRAAALALPDVKEVPHMDRAAFRTPRRIFATLAADEQTANLYLPLPVQEAFSHAQPEAFAPVAGGWGRMGWTCVTLDRAPDAALRDALAAAHRHAKETRGAGPRA